MTADTPADVGVGRGIAMTLAAYLLLSISDASIKDLTERLSIFQIAAIRNVISMLPLIWFVRREGGWSALKIKDWRLHLLRGVIYAALVFLVFFAFSQLPFAEVFSIFFVAPLLMTAMGAVFLRQKVGIRRWTAVVIGFLGVVFILRPEGEQLLSLGSMAAFAGATGYALALILVRIMTDRGESVSAMVFSANTIAILAGVGATLFLGWSPLIARDVALLILAGLTSGAAFILLTAAFRSYPVSVLAPMEYSAMIWAVLFGYVFWGEIPSDTVWIGSAVLIGTGLYLIHRERQIELRQRTLPPVAPRSTPS